MFEVEHSPEIQLFFVAAQLLVLFLRFFLALYLCDRLRVLSVRKELHWSGNGNTLHDYMAQLFGSGSEINTAPQ